MLGRRNQYALTHQAGGVTDFGDIATGGGNFKVVEVGATEDDAGFPLARAAGAWLRARRSEAQSPQIQGVPQSSVSKCAGVANTLSKLCKTGRNR